MNSIYLFFGRRSGLPRHIMRRLGDRNDFWRVKVTRGIYDSWIGLRGISFLIFSKSSPTWLCATAGVLMLENVHRRRGTIARGGAGARRVDCIIIVIYICTREKNRELERNVVVGQVHDVRRPWWLLLYNITIVVASLPPARVSRTYTYVHRVYNTRVYGRRICILYYTYMHITYI